MMKRTAAALLLLLTAGWFLLPRCDALTYKFRKVGEGITPYSIYVPGGPAIQGDAVVFLGTSSNGVLGLYRDTRGVVEVVADQLTPAPKSSGRFLDFQPAFAVAGNDIVFVASTPEGLGIYASRDGVLEQCRPDIPLPGFSQPLTRVAKIGIHGDTVAFSTDGLSYTDSSVYMLKSGVVSRVAGPGTLLPPLGQVADEIGLLGIDETGITFAGMVRNAADGSRQAGVFRFYEGAITPLIGLGMTMPDDPGGFGYIGGGFSKRGELAFSGEGSTRQSTGVYRLFQGQLTVVANTQTRLPGWGQAQASIGFASFDGGNVTFGANTMATPFDSTEARFGLFQQIGDELALAVDKESLLDGRHPTNFEVGPQALSGNSLVFLAHFTTAPFESIYIAEAVLDDYETVTADFDGDKKSDVSLYQPRTGTWYMRRTEKDFRTRQFGYSGIKAVPADYDGDGEEDVADYEPSTGNWYILNTNSDFSVTQFGYFATDPVPADYDGDGQDDISVYEPLTGTWYILESGSSALRIQQWGYAATKPVPADYDGDGKDDICVYEPNTGNWFILESGSNSLRIQQWGYAATDPVPANFDGGADDIAVYEPSTGTWYINGSESGFRSQQWGYSATDPLPADYDGDGLDDISVYEPATGTWYSFGSSTGFSVGKL